MNRSFLSNLAFLLLLNTLVKPFWLFGIEVSVQNAVGPESYGLYYAVLNLTFMFNILLDFGINNFNNRHVAREGRINPYTFSSLLILRCLLCFGYGIFTVFVAWLLGYGTMHWYFLGWLMVNQILIAFIQFFRSNLAGLHLFRRDSIVSVLDRALLIVLFGILLWPGMTDQTFQIEWFVLGQTAAYAITCIVAALLCLGKFNLLLWKFRRKKMLALLSNSFPFALLTLLMTLYYKIDGVMIERLLPDGAGQAGIYAQSFRILEAGNIVGYLFAGLLLPVFSRLIKYKALEEIGSLVSTACRLLIVPSCMVWLISMFYAEELLSLLYKSHVAESAFILKWLMGTFICLSTGFVFGTLITASGKMRKLNILAALTLLVNVALNAFLIPSFKAEGAAIASLASMLVMAIGQVLISLPLFGRFTTMGMVKMLGVLLLNTIGFYLVDLLSPLAWHINLMFSLLATVLFYLLLGGLRKSDFGQFSGTMENGA